MKNRVSLIALGIGLVLLAGCHRGGAWADGPSGGGGGTIKAINHTKWAVNRFSVNGQSGIDAIGPYDGGGGGCCYGVPAQWQPGMMVRVDWESGIAYAEDIPEIPEPVRPKTDGMPRKEYEEAWRVYGEQRSIWFKKIKALSRQLSRTVPLPDYTGQKVCGITVHFLPCDEVKVTTSCWSPASENYPFQLPLRMEEPKVCPN